MRPFTLTPACRTLACVACFVGLLVLMGCEDRARNEARLVLARIETIDHDAPTPQRKAFVASLKALSLSSTEVRQVRDACVRAHQALIDAETEKETASRQLEVMERAEKNKALAPGGGRSVAEALRRSEAAVARVRESFPVCEREALALARRYGPR